MRDILLAAGVICAAAGLGLAVWSIIDDWRRKR